MSESPDESDIARFSYPKRSMGGRRHLVITYRNITVRMDWPDSDIGRSDLARFTNALPQLMESAQSEMDVLNHMRNIESEIEELLGGNGPDCEEEK